MKEGADDHHPHADDLPASNSGPPPWTPPSQGGLLISLTITTSLRLSRTWWKCSKPLSILSSQANATNGATPWRLAWFRRRRIAKWPKRLERPSLPPWCHWRWLLLPVRHQKLVKSPMKRFSSRNCFQLMAIVVTGVIFEHWRFGKEEKTSELSREVENA